MADSRVESCVELESETPSKEAWTRPDLNRMEMVETENNAGTGSDGSGRAS